MTPIDLQMTSVNLLDTMRVICTLVLIFCVEFRELSHLTRDLSQAEKKIDFVTS